MFHSSEKRKSVEKIRYFLLFTVVKFVHEFCRFELTDIIKLQYFQVLVWHLYLPKLIRNILFWNTDIGCRTDIGCAP